MLLYAGIDEAGYGPLLGPLVVARSVFLLSELDPSQPAPCLWEHLKEAVCRQARGAGGRIPVSDSKRLYTPAVGLGRLERSVLTLLPGALPGTLAELMEALAVDELSRSSEHPWYRDQGGWPLLPSEADAAELPRLRAEFSARAAAAGVRLQEVKAAVVFADRFNRLVARWGSKGRVAWEFVAGHLRDIWEEHGEAEPRVVVDRQGGRKAYGELLVELFPGARVEVLGETPAWSRYRVSRGGRRLHLEIRVDSEAAHLPAACASMAAKYLRELWLLRFRRFWAQVAPAVRPTRGYFRDGTRFLREIEAFLPALGVARENLVRCC